MKTFQESTVTSIEEKRLNKDLVDNQKQCIMPDIILDKVNEYIHFETHHGPKKGQPENLVSQRLYVIDDNIEVFDDEEQDVHYNSIDKIKYTSVMERCKSSGFTKLKIIKAGSTSIKSKRSSSSSSLSDTISNKSDDDLNIPSCIPESKIVIEDDYDYSKIISTRDPLPLLHGNNSNIPLPPNVSKSVRIRNLEVIFTEDEEEKVELFKYLYFLDSAVFDKHFKDVFPSVTAELLGFSQEDIETAKHAAGMLVFINLN